MTITFNETGKLKVTIEERIDDADIEIFYELYEQAFGPLRTKAAARQVLHPDEFREEMVDPRVLKFVSWSDDGEPLGMSTLTNCLDTVPWISADYYRTQYPDHAARDAIYYLGFTLVRNDVGPTTAFRDAVEVLITKMADEQAIMCLDICGHHTDKGFAEVLERMAHAVAPTKVEVMDTQTYFVAAFEAARRGVQR